MLNLYDPTLLKTKAFISGKWTNSASKQKFAVVNPATSHTIATVTDSGCDDVKSAVVASNQAMISWRLVPAKEKSKILKKWASLMGENLEDLAKIMTAEQGKPLAESRGEIWAGADTLEWFAEEAKRTYGDVIPSPVGGRQTLVIKQPVGIAAAITPWNFPILMIARKAGPAIAAGCAIILKPSEETPLSALALAELSLRAGVPTGLFNVLPSNKAAEVGQEMTANPDIKKLTFTGSSRVGKLLMSQCANSVKRMSMELGGNAPFIVLDDADLDAAIDGVMMSKFRNSGQTCVCANRIYVQSGIYEEFSRKLSKRVSSLVVGRGETADVTIGPLINNAAAQRAAYLVVDAESKGAKILGSPEIREDDLPFFNPVIIKNAQKNMRVFSEEIFAPIAPLFEFCDEDEVIKQANDTPYGLAAYVYTSNLNRAWKFSESLEYGMVGVNEGVISTELAPFGGWKESGQGREGSKYGIDEYLEIKYICMGGLTG